LLVNITKTTAIIPGTIVKEFISLDKKANYEAGYVIIDNNSTSLTYTALIYERIESTDSLAALNEESQSPLLLMSTEDGEMPDFETIKVNIPNDTDGYTCDDIEYEEIESTIIQDHEIIMIEATNCSGEGLNVGKTKNINIKLTDSMFVGGSSKIDLIDGKAYLNTEFELDDNTLLEGGLGTRAYNQIFDLIENMPNIATLVEKKISGSIHDDINMQTGRLIRKAGLSIHLEKDSDIASGGVDLFCAGKQRSMEEGAKLGVHSWAGDGIEAGELPVDSPLHDIQINYFNEMLGSPVGKEFYFFTINSASADDIKIMDNDEIEKYELLTNQE
jgi:hypothetical protein